MFALCIQAPVERHDDVFNQSGRNPWGRWDFRNFLYCLTKAYSKMDVV